MNVSSRTPEGQPNHCSICQTESIIEPSTAGDATCPRCGQLMWWLNTRLSDRFGADASHIEPSTKFIEDLGADSLDTVELIMELEEEFDIRIPDDEAEQINSVGAAIRYIKNHETTEAPS